MDTLKTMRRWLIIPLIIMVGSAWIAAGVASWQASSVIAPAIADNLRVDSPQEQILAAREADAAAKSSGGWGWLAFAGLFCVSGAIGLLTVARPFLKELRLGAKAFKNRGNGRPSPIIFPQASHVPQVPQLMEDSRQWQENDWQQR